MRFASWTTALGLAFLFAACGGKSSTSTSSGSGGSGATGGSGGTGGFAACAPGQGQAADGTCFDVGLQGCAAMFVDPDGVCRPTLDKCPMGKLPKMAEGCADVGIPSCAADFLEADGICHVSTAKCAAGTFAVPQKGCVSLDGPDGCGTDTWGLIADDPGNVYVDASYGGGSSDGSKAKPFTTIAGAMAVVGIGGRIVLAAGDYAEPVTVSHDLKIAGRCASMVTVHGDDGDATLPKVIHATAGSLAIRGITVSGEGVGVYAEGGAVVTLDNVVIQDAKLAGAIAADMAQLSVAFSLVRDTRADNFSDFSMLGNGFGISATLGSTVTVTDSALTGNKTAGLHVIDTGTTLTVKDTLVEGTRSSYLEGDGIAVEIFGDTYDTGVNLDISATAIVDSESYGMKIARSAVGTPVVKVTDFVIEGTPGTGAIIAQSAIWLSGASVELHRGVTARSMAAVESTFYDIDNHATLVMDQMLMRDGELYAGDGTITITDAAFVDALPPALFLAPDQIADMILGDIHLDAQRVIVDSPGGSSGALYGYGVYLGGNADAKFDSLFVTKARAAGLLANQTATVSATHTTFSATQTGKFYVDNQEAEAGDGLVAADQATITLDGVRVEQCARVGLLFDAAKGTITRSLSTKNAFGVVLQDSAMPVIDKLSEFAQNSQQDMLGGGDLSVPTSPAASPP